MIKILLSAALATLLSVAPAAAHAQVEGPVPTQVLVSVDSKSAYTPTSADLTAEVNGKPTPITNISPIPPSAVQIALLIDDGLRSSFGVQLQDIQKWVTTLPAGTQIFIGYMQNGRVKPAQNFTTDYATAARQVRLPMSIAGANGSPYFALSDFLRRWPSSAEAALPGQPAPTPNQAHARFILMITNGVDLYNGSVSPLNQNSPYVNNAANDALRAGIPVYSIYFGDRAVRGRFASFSGQSYLAQIADTTGGQAFYQGTFNPVSLTPFFDQFNKAIASSYVITFDAPSRKKDDTVRLKLNANQKGVKLHAPNNVRPGQAAAGL